jgi:hypothetical protein
VIIRTTDGGFVVAGTTGTAWATQVNASGALQWEHLDTRDESLGGPSQSQYAGAVALADESILLCGFKTLRNGRAGLITRIGKGGQLLENRVVRPNDDDKYTFSGLSACLPWGDGFALVGGGGLATVGGGTGWLTKLDAQGGRKWERLDPEMRGGTAMEMSDHSLLLVSQRFEPLGVKFVRVDPSGGIVAERYIPGDHFVVLRSVIPSENVPVAVTNGPTTSLFELNHDLKDAQPPRAIARFLAEQGFQLPE